MNVYEYATIISSKIENTSVREVTKANGVVLTGISLKVTNSSGLTIEPTVYVDGYYNDNVEIEKATEMIRKTFEEAATENIDISFYTDYEQVKKHLTVALFNQSCKAQFPVNRSAKSYGFSDLIIVPKVTVYSNGEPLGSITVTEKHVTAWGVTKATVINDALKNSENDFQILSIEQALCHEEGAVCAEEIESYTLDHFEVPFIVITNRRFVNGASAVLSKKLKANLERIFREFGGYSLIPSSVHEMIAVPLMPENTGMIDAMIPAVNDEKVQAQEVLGTHAYLFKIAD